MGGAVPGAIKKSAGLPAIFSASPVQRAVSALNPASQRPCAWQSPKLCTCPGLCIVLFRNPAGRGRLRDAATLSAVAALQSLRFPALSAAVLTKAEVPYDLSVKTGLHSRHTLLFLPEIFYCRQ